MARECLGGAGRLSEPPLGGDGFRRLDRFGGFGGTAEGLVEALAGCRSKAQGQRGARHRLKVGYRFETEATESEHHVFVEAQCRNGQRADRRGKGEWNVEAEERTSGVPG